MRFAEWWATISDAEQKLIGINNARFVWEEAQKNQVSVMSLPNFMLTRTKDKVVIMSHHGEGGTFDIADFDKAVSLFFAKNF